ncbi:hypothetical protein NG796_01620 [Laspinema sp. A4]|nr:hypothetical protein [Laspinema sp. D2d]
MHNWLFVLVQGFRNPVSFRNLGQFGKSDRKNPVSWPFGAGSETGFFSSIWEVVQQ